MSAQSRPPAWLNPSHSLRAIITWALVITLGQILFCALAQTEDNLLTAYRNLYEWDAVHYGRLVEEGYKSDLVIHANYDPLDTTTYTGYSTVAFLPGYVLFGGLMKTITGLATRDAQLLAAALSAWGFWTYLLLFAKRWQLSPAHTWAAVLAIALHPAAFFLVVPYSESLFLASLLGFFYWCGSDRKQSWLLASAHGFVMTATRMVGVPMLVFPIVVSLFKVKDQADRQPAMVRQAHHDMLVIVLASLGVIFFFAYSHFTFGYWNLYFYTQAINWKLIPDYLIIFHEKASPLFWPHWPDIWNGNAISRLLAAPTLWVLLAALAAQWQRRQTGPRPGERWALLLAALLLFYFHVAAVLSLDWGSMVRYLLPVWTLIVLGGAGMLRDVRWRNDAWRICITAGALAGIVALMGEAALVRMFVSRVWVG